MVNLELMKLTVDAKIPFKSRKTDAGFDLYTTESYVIEPHQAVNFSTGLSICAPPGYYYTIDGRSSLWSKGIIPFRGIIDGGYTGEVKVALINFGQNPYKINKYDRIAQIILHKIIDAEFNVVTNFTKEFVTRGENGFGSSGR